MSITRRNLQREHLTGAFEALGMYEKPLDGCIKVMYTRQTGGNWTFFIGQCVLGENAPNDRSEVYPNFAFVQKSLRQTTIKALLESLTGDGIEAASGLPVIRLAASHPNWNEEIIPSHAARYRTPFRRFSATVESNAFFPDGQLIHYTLPYRPSAAQYMKEFLAFKVFHGSADGRKGEFTIEVPDPRGAIRFAGGLVSITEPTVPLRLVGAINGDTLIDVRNNSTADYDENDVRSVELWLLTKDNEIVDCISTTEWPHKYEPPASEKEREEQLLESIRRGESETREFKPYIDLANQKAGDLGKTVCALSNQKGGTLFIGVTDEGDIVGLAREIAKRPDELEKALAEYEKAVCARLRETLKDNQCFKSQLVTLKGVRVLVIEVARSPEVNYFVSSDLAQLAYIRNGGTSAKMSPPEIQAKAQRQDGFTYAGLPG